MPAIHPRRLPVRVAFGLAFAFSALALAGCEKKAEVTSAKVEQEPPPPPPPPPKPKPKQGGNDGKGGDPAGFDPLSGLLGTTPAPGSPTEQALLQKYKTALVGTWSADLSMGVTEELTYTATGAYTAKLTGPMPASATGKYAVLGLVGTKGLKIQLDSGTGPRTITATFDDNELQHPTLQPGVTGTFRKK